MKKRMKKRIVLCVLILSIIAAVVVPAATASDSYPTVNIYINGQKQDLEVPAMLIGSTTYVPVRAFSHAMGADTITWDGASATSTVYGPGVTISAKVNSDYFVANGRYLYTPTGCKLVNSNFMLPIRQMVKAFGSSLEWDGSSRSVYITKGYSSITPASGYYNSDDVYWLSRIIHAEANGEGLLGQLAVGNVIMNRVKSPLYPNTVKNVIFDKRSGIQFTPAYSGAIYNTPRESCIIAAKMTLEGDVSVVGSSLFFTSSRSSWASRNRPYVTTIGNHYFYA